METDDLFEELYTELRKIAAQRMRAEARHHTLQTTALINEAYLRLSKVEGSRWSDRKHFLSTAARTMRRVLIDHARRRKRRVSLAGQDPDLLAVIPGPVDFLEFDRALESLGTEHPRSAAAIEYRYILGLTADETAQVLEVSNRTVRGDTSFGLAWLRRQLAAV